MSFSPSSLRTWPKANEPIPIRIRRRDPWRKKQISTPLCVGIHDDYIAAIPLEQVEQIATDLRAYYGAMLTHANSHFSFGVALDGVQFTHLSRIN